MARHHNRSVDPLEAAMVREAPAPRPEPPQAIAPSTEREEEAAPAAPVAQEGPRLLAADPLSSAPRARLFRVMRDAVVSCGGHVTTMRRGKVVDPAKYGAEGMRRLLEAGVDLEPLPDIYPGQR